MSKKKSTLATIPQPDGLPFFGNTLSLNGEAPIQSMSRIARTIDAPIFRLDLMGSPFVAVKGVEIAEEVCDESRFDKTVRGPLRKLRAIAGDGLFTGDTTAPNWSKAHNILLPTFAQKAMHGYLDMMYDIALQLVQKWERTNSDDEINVPKDMIGLTLDTIGLCGFGYRFNSFYREGYHPFIEALTRTLVTIRKQRGLPLEGARLRQDLAQLPKDVAYMNNLVDEIIAERRRLGGDQRDLLNFMLEGKDRVTGEGLSDENIRYQINTFLIAGHETTSGMLSFALTYLLKHPDILERARNEVDDVLGRHVDEKPTMEQISKLVYTRAILLEALRLWPTAPSFAVAPFQDEVLGGKYEIPAGTFVSVLVPELHRDKSVWGDDPEAFRPENFLPEAEAARNPAAYKPFGNGQRACIGRQFAIQEAVLVLGMILQRFDLNDHRNYELKVQETLSLKPDGFYMKVKLRDDVVRGPARRPAQNDEPEEETTQVGQRPSHGTRLTVLYGSNLGQTETFARDLTRSGELNGFDVEIAELDEKAGDLPRDGVVVLACASYNGSPPDNAGQFVKWLETAAPGSLSGVTYTTLGCGSTDWAATFQAVPRKIDELMEKAGAQRLLPATELDSKEDMDSGFQDWLAGIWPPIGEHFGLDIDFSEEQDKPPLYRVEFTQSVTTNPVARRIDAREMEIVVNEELQGVDVGASRSTRHIEVSLPKGETYQPGDHLCVVPKNGPQLIGRLLDRFGLDEDTYIRIFTRSDVKGAVPHGETYSVYRLAESVGELQAVATRKDIRTMLRHTRCPDTQKKLQALCAREEDGNDLYRSEVSEKRKSLLDLLEEFPACELPFNIYLELVPWMTPRYYSISSSPNAAEGKLSITAGVVRGPALSGVGEYRGVCSNYLSGLEPGAVINAVVREPSGDFRLPEDPQVPVIMIGPGTGLAPFRGFLQERAARQAKGETLGDAMLFFGCRHPEHDFYYKAEIEDYAKRGIVDLHTAFSRVEGSEKVYVQDVLDAQSEKVWKLLEGGAKIYVCGDGARMEPSVRAALVKLFCAKKGVSEQLGEAWIDEMTASSRYLLDVWAG